MMTSVYTNQNLSGYQAFHPESYPQTPPANEQYFESLDDGHSFAEIIEIIKRRKAIIINFTLAFLALALIYSFLAASLYSSTTQILIDPRERRLMDNGIAPRDFTSETGVSLVESQMKVLTSDALLLNVIDKEQLIHDEEFGAKKEGTLQNILKALKSALGINPEKSPEQNALRILSKDVTVKRSEKAFIVEIKVTTKQADKSARIANSIVQTFLENQAGASFDANRRASKSLSSRLDELREGVRISEDQVEKYKEENNIVGGSGKLVTEQQLSEINNQLIIARGRTAELKARIEQIQKFQKSGGDISSISEAMSSQTISSLRNQIAEVTRQESDLLTTLGPKHPQIQSIQRQILDLRKLIVEEVRRIALSAQSDYDRALANEKALDQSLSTIKKTQLSSNSASVKLRELEREVETNRSIYNAFLLRSRETGEQERLDTSNVRVISTAKPSNEKSWPPTPLLIGLGLALGLGFGIGFALLREATDSKLYSKRQVEEISKLPFLGGIKSLTQQENANLYTLSLQNPSGDFAQNINHISNQLAGKQRGRDKSKLLFVSDMDNDIRSGLIMNLALKAAKQGQNVLVIDADFNQHLLTSNIVSAPSLGFFDVISEQRHLNDALLYDHGTGVYFLPLTTPFAQLLQTPVNRRTLEPLFKAAKLFNLVLIDAGSMNDNRTLEAFAQFADDIILTLNYGKTTKPRLKQTMASLGSFYHRLAGTIFLNSKMNYNDDKQFS